MHFTQYSPDPEVLHMSKSAVNLDTEIAVKNQSGGETPPFCDEPGRQVTKTGEG